MEVGGEHGHILLIQFKGDVSVKKVGNRANNYMEREKVKDLREREKLKDLRERKTKRF